MSRFQVGEVLEIIGAFRRNDLIGLECTVVGEEKDRLCVWMDGSQAVVFGYKVKVHGDVAMPAGLHDGTFTFLREFLRKRRPPQETASWSSCAWQPEGVRV